MIPRVSAKIVQTFRPNNRGALKRFRAEDGKWRLSLGEILMLIGPRREFYLTTKCRLGETPMRGTRTVFSDANTEQYPEQPRTHTIRAAVQQHYGHRDPENPNGKPRLSSIDIGSALAIYRKIVAGSNAEAMYGPDDGRTLAAYGAIDDDRSVTTNRAEFERIRAELNGHIETATM